MLILYDYHSKFLQYTQGRGITPSHFSFSVCPITGCDAEYDDYDDVYDDFVDESELFI